MRNVELSGKGVGSVVAGFFALALLASACNTQKGAVGSGEAPSGEFGTVVLALTSVPADVQCVRVTVTGNSTVVRTFDVVPGTSANLTMGGLPLGNATVYEDTFNTACANVGAQSIPTWVAQAPVPVTLSPNTQSSVTIVLRRPAGLMVGMDYQEGGGGLSVLPASANFGEVLLGAASAPQTFTVTNGTTTSASVSLALSGANAGEFTLVSNQCSAPLPGGGSCVFQLTLLPSSPGAKVATIVAAAPGAGSVSVPLAGTGVTSAFLTFTAGMGAFGTVPVGQSADHSFTITNGNPQSQTTGPISTALQGTDAAQFQILQNTCLAPLSGGGTCTVVVRFQPTSSGAKTATLAVNASPGGGATTLLTGTGGGGALLTISPTSQDFGAVTIGDATSMVRTFTITNTSAFPAMAVTTIIGAGSAPDPDPNDFVVSSACFTPLPAGGTCVVGVRYVPDANLAVTSTAAVNVNAIINGAPATVSAQLSGTRLTDADIDFHFNDADLAEAQSLGNVRLGTTVTLTRTVVNSGQTATGPLVLNLAGAQAAEYSLGAGTCGSVANTTTTLAPGASCTVIINHTPTVSDLSTRTATLTVTSTGRGGTSGVLTLTSIASPAAYAFLTPNPADLGAGSVGLNPAPVVMTFTNVTGAPTAPLAVATGNPAFVISNSTCPTSAFLANGATCTFDVQFQPQAATPVGFLRGTVTVSETGGAARVFAGGLFGRKQPSASVTIMPPFRDFGAVPIATQSAPFTFIATNVGELSVGPLTVEIAGSDPALFLLSGGTCQGAQLAVGATCTASVIFSPNSPGVKSAILTLLAGPNAVASAMLTGTGGSGSLTITPTSQDFGEVPLNVASFPQAFTVTNGTTTSAAVLLTVSGANATDFIITSNQCTAPLPVGGACVFQVIFQPTSPGPKIATVTAAPPGAGSASAPLAGTGVTSALLTFTAGTPAFGTVPVGQSVDHTFTVTNSGSQTTGPINSTLMGTDAAQFQILQSTCLTSLPGGGSCTLVVRFQPTTTGARSATLAVAASPGGGTSILLTGTGGGGAALSLNPPSLSFNNVPVGSRSATQDVVVSNTGTATSDLLSVSLTGVDAAHYQIAASTCSGTLAPSATCLVKLRFAPNTLGSKTATFNVTPLGAPAVSASLTGTVIDWLHQDVGAIGMAPGNWSQANGVHTVNGAGADIWGAADAFHYVYENVSGNATITARVLSIQNRNQWSKAVVMMRSTTAAGAPYAAAVVPALASNQYRQQFRTTAGGGSTSNPGGSGAPNAWLRVTRVGNTFSTFFSSDGNTFTPLGTPQTITMPTTITMGIGVTSHVPDVLATGTFDQVSITTP